jgi:hypothetical protein
MKILKLTNIIFLFLLSTELFASINLNVKINHQVGSQSFEFSKNLKAEYNKEITIFHDQLKNKIILTFIKLNKIVSDGNDIHPVQIGMKLVDEKEKEIGRPQTITSFYNHPAYFEVPSTGLVSDISDLKVYLSFEEKN